MNKENLKNFVLIFLIILSIFLTKELWFNNKLWSSDYNFFVNMRKLNIVKIINSKLPWYSNEKVKFNVLKENLFYPKRITVNYGDKRFIYYLNDDSYYYYTDFVIKVMSDLKSNESSIKQTNTDYSEWKNALKSKSIMVDFGVNIDTRVLEKLLGLKDNIIKKYTDSVYELLIVPDYSISKNILIYIKDNNKDNSIKKIVLSNIEEKYNEIFKTGEKEDKLSYTYSFERGFDVKKVNKIVIDSEIAIPRGYGKADQIEVFGPDINNKQYIDSILDAFEYSSTVYRQHTETDDTRVFVKNYNTLKINPNGYIQFKTLQPGKGVDLRDNAELENRNIDLYESLNLAIGFMDTIGMLDKNLAVTSDLVNKAEDKSDYKFSFNYYYNGIPLIINSNKYGFMHAAEIQITNGHIEYFTCNMKEFEKVKTIDAERNMLQALDILYNRIGEGKDELKVRQAFTGYLIDENDEVYLPQWCFKIEDDSRIYAVPIIK